MSAKVTAYEVRLEADRAERPPQGFTAVWIHDVIAGFEIDAAAVAEAIRLSEEKYCSVGAMVQKMTSFDTTYEIRRRQDRVDEATCRCRSPTVRLRFRFGPRLTLGYGVSPYWYLFTAFVGLNLCSRALATGIR